MMKLNRETGNIEMTVADVEREFIRQGSPSGDLIRIVNNAASRKFKSAGNRWIVLEGKDLWSDFRTAERIFRNSKVVWVSPPCADIRVTLIRR
jgi:hypothetical protein